MKILFLSLLILLSISAVADDSIVILTSKNVISVSEPITRDGIYRIASEGNALDRVGIFNSNEPIFLFLNSPGGDIEAGLEIIELLNGLNRPVGTITLFAASMAFQFVEQLRGPRYIVKSGVMMSHRARGGIEGEFGGSAPDQISSRLSFWERRIAEMDRQTVSRTHGIMTVKQYEDAYISELWLTGQESTRLGLSDKVVTVRCDKTLDGVTRKSVNFMSMKIDYSVSKCPINTGVSDISMQLSTNKGYVDFNKFVEEGGSFGIDCLILASTNAGKLCATNTDVDKDKILNIKQEFIENYGKINGKLFR